uniref:Uncharacterized protein n=1 Tax=Setaria viridis TaxID=4556 RepID=A0A4U6TE44_SETVI|nr:hypothetical protein SEVIR_9G364850v2 [Setaria viridis]
MRELWWRDPSVAHYPPPSESLNIPRGKFRPPCTTTSHAPCGLQLPASPPSLRPLGSKDHIATASLTPTTARAAPSSIHCCLVVKASLHSTPTPPSPCILARTRLSSPTWPLKCIRGTESVDDLVIKLNFWMLQQFI